VNGDQETVKSVERTKSYQRAHPDPVGVNAEHREAKGDQKDGDE
jgi:hypothetical protein